MSSYSSQSMTSLTHLVNAVNAWSGPALTQYGAERVELGGPVAGRWLAKIAHYLTNDLAADLFGTGEPTPARFYTSLQPWQDVLWQIAARAMGWEHLRTRNPLPGDLLITNTLTNESDDALNAGAHVLAQTPTYLSFAWEGTLGGALDALAQIATSPDTITIPTPAILPAVRDDALEGTRATQDINGKRVALLWDTHTGAGQVLDQWMAGRSVVIIDPQSISPDQLPHIVTSEAVDAGLALYTR